MRTSLHHHLLRDIRLFQHREGMHVLDQHQGNPNLLKSNVIRLFGHLHLTKHKNEYREELPEILP